MGRIRVVISALHFNQTIQNVLHMNNSNGALTLQQIANDIDGGFIDAIRTRSSGDIKWVGVLVTDLDNPLVAPFSLITDKPGLDLGSNSIPPFVSHVLKLSTNRAGRHGRGRIFVGGVHFNAVVSGVFSSAFQTSYKTSVTDVLMSQYGAGNSLELCVREEDGGAGVFHPVTAIQLRNTPGCQRRRNVGVGI